MGLNILPAILVPCFSPGQCLLLCPAPPTRPPSPSRFTLFGLVYIVFEVQNPIGLMPLPTKPLFVSFFSIDWPLKDNVSHQAHHHGGQDGAVDGDEVFVEPMAEESWRAAAGCGRLSSWQRTLWALGEEVICEGGWRWTHFEGGSDICWEERI